MKPGSSQTSGAVSSGAPAQAADTASSPSPPNPFGKFGDLLVMMPLLYAMNQFDFENEDTIFYTRIGFAFVQVVQIALIFYIWSVKINGNPDTTTISIPKQPALGTPPPTRGETEEIMVAQYDAQQCKKQVTQLLFTTALIGFLHHNWGFTQPLFMQIFMSPMNLFKHALIKAHLFGDRVARPFEEPNPFAGLMPQPAEASAQSSSGSIAPTPNPSGKPLPATQSSDAVDEAGPRVEELDEDELKKNE